MPGFPPSGDPTKHRGKQPPNVTLGEPAAKPPALPKPIHVDANGKATKGKWRPETVDWYKTWCRAPQSGMFLETDWQRLHQIAGLVDAYYAMLDIGKVAGAATIHSEIRRNEQLLGATPEDRLRLRWKHGDAAKPGGDSEKRKPSRGSRPDARLKLVDDKAS